MKWRVISGLLTVCFSLTPFMVFAQTAADIQKHPDCKYCGMDRQKFGHSRMLVTYNDGSEFGSCSMHCAAINLALNIDKTPTQIQVGDYNTKNLIDAEKATWVIGGNKPGVMSKNAKWAFEKPADAEAFVKENQGQVGNFDEAMKVTFADMYSDCKMIREKRAKMKMMQQPQQQQQQQTK
jgi:copper chaperone NosL